MADHGVQAIGPAARRPIAVTVVCAIMIIGAVATVPLMFSEPARSLSLPSWYPSYLCVSALIGLACAVGLWMMRKWAVHTYIAFGLINQVIISVIGVWHPLALLLLVVRAGVMLIYLPRMK